MSSTSSNSSPDGISCIIPVYNEVSSIAETVRGVHKVLSDSDRPFELILIDDGSVDGSLETAQEIAKESGISIISISHNRNRGYGAAIKSGMRHASYPWILLIDADQTYPPEEIGVLLENLDREPETDMIVGRRKQSRQTDGPFRLMGKSILGALANFLASRTIPDLNSGLRLVRRSLLRRYRSLLPDGFSLTTTITLALLCSGGHVIWTPIHYRRRRGTSKIRPVRDMLGFITLIVRTMIYFNPLKVFIPLTIFFVLASFVVTVGSKLIGGQVMDVTALFLFIAGLQMLLIGVVADLILKLIGTGEE